MEGRIGRKKSFPKGFGRDCLGCKFPIFRCPAGGVEICRAIPICSSMVPAIGLAGNPHIVQHLLLVFCWLVADVASQKYTTAQLYAYRPYASPPSSLLQAGPWSLAKNSPWFNKRLPANDYESARLRSLGLLPVKISVHRQQVPLPDYVTLALKDDLSKPIPITLAKGARMFDEQAVATLKQGWFYEHCPHTLKKILDLAWKPAAFLACVADGPDPPKPAAPSLGSTLEASCPKVFCVFSPVWSGGRVHCSLLSRKMVSCGRFATPPSIPGSMCRLS